MDMQEASIEGLKIYYEEGKNPLAYIPYADALRKNGQLTKAMEICISGLKQDSYSLTGRTLLARIFYDMGRYENAICELKVALQISHDSFGPNLLYARVLMKQRSYNDAAIILYKLLKIKPTDADVIQLRKELDKFIASAKTNVSPIKMFDTPEPTKQGEGKTNIEEKLKMLKNALRDYPEVISIDIDKLEIISDRLKSGDADTLPELYNYIKYLFNDKKFGDTKKGFIEVLQKNYLFYGAGSYLLTICVKSTSKLGRLKKDIEQYLYT